MDLSIIIVNWNSKEYLKKCIASILAETHGIEFEIVVIDSASFDGCGDMLREHYPQVRFIQSQENLGFSRANNLAFQSAKGECVLFLNPDTQLVSPAINILHSLLKSLPDAGAVGGKLLNSDGTIQTSCIQSFPTFLNQVLNAEVLRRRFPRSHLWGIAALFNKGEKASEVEVISGACLMMDRSLFERVGRFSADYFMYSEDVDLCFQIRKAGMKNYYVPSAIVVHHGGTSSSQTGVGSFSSVMMIESSWRFFLKTRSFGYCCFYRTSMLVVSLVRTLAVLLLLAAWSGEKRRWRATLNKSAAKLRWTLGLEGWVRNY